MIRKLKSGGFRLYSRKKDPRTGKRKNLGTFKSLAAASGPSSSSSGADGGRGRRRHERRDAGERATASAEAMKFRARTVAPSRNCTPRVRRPGDSTGRR